MIVTTKKIIDIINEVKNGLLIIKIKKKQGFPHNWDNTFDMLYNIRIGNPINPIWIANGKMDLVILKRQQIIVDGNSRINTICEFIVGATFKELTDSEKSKFLNYDVTICDIGDADSKMIAYIKEITN